MKSLGVAARCTNLLRVNSVGMLQSSARGSCRHMWIAFANEQRELAFLFVASRPSSTCVAVSLAFSWLHLLIISIRRVTPHRKCLLATVFRCHSAGLRYRALHARASGARKGMLSRWGRAVFHCVRGCEHRARCVPGRHCYRTIVQQSRR